MTVSSRSHRLFASLLPCLLAGCAVLQPSVPAPVAASGEGWGMQRLPGKRETMYAPAQRQGQPCLLARADRSASLWRRRIDPAQAGAGTIRFSWWAGALAPEATVAESDQDDAVARVVLAFDGDLARLSLRNRMMFDLAQTLTGEAPPYATLMYVWDAQAPVGSVIVSGRTDRIRKIVVESGPRQLGVWRHYERDLRADFERAFGEMPGALTGLAYMTDADNTQGRAEACYGPAQLR